MLRYLDDDEKYKSIKETIFAMGSVGDPIVFLFQGKALLSSLNKKNRFILIRAMAIAATRVGKTRNQVYDDIDDYLTTSLFQDSSVESIREDLKYMSKIIIILLEGINHPSEAKSIQLVYNNYYYYYYVEN